VAGEFDGLEALATPDFVAVAPDFSQRAYGDETFVEGLKAFSESATIHEFSEGDIEVDVMADTAVATYRYRLDYERSGDRYLSTGRDLYVLARRHGHWLALWRTLLDVEERPFADASG
jgi:ketosteroid isomerase-like protein